MALECPGTQCTTDISGEASGPHPEKRDQEDRDVCLASGLLNMADAPCIML